MIKIRPSAKSISVVVSSYKENLDWVDKIKHKVLLYNKSEEGIERADAIKLENIGRESHTYLYHIVKNYDRLDDITVFCQGHPFDHCPEFVEIVNQCNNLIAMNEICKKLDNNRSWPNINSDFCPIGHRWVFDTTYYIKEDWEYQNKIPFCALAMEVMFPRFKPIKQLNGIWGANFGVSKECVHQHSLSKYQKLLDYHNEFWSIPWAMECVWAHFFYGPDQPKIRF